MTNITAEYMPVTKSVRLGLVRCGVVSHIYLSKAGWDRLVSKVETAAAEHISPKPSLTFWLGADAE